MMDLYIKQEPHSVKFARIKPFHLKMYFGQGITLGSQRDFTQAPNCQTSHKSIKESTSKVKSSQTHSQVTTTIQTALLKQGQMVSLGMTPEQLMDYFHHNSSQEDQLNL